MMPAMAKSGSGGHGVGVTKVRAIRVSDELWEAALLKAQADHPEDKRGALGNVIREFLQAYVGDKSLRAMDTPDE